MTSISRDPTKVQRLARRTAWLSALALATLFSRAALAGA